METQPTITTQNTTLAVIGDDDPFTAYANAMAPRNIVGTLLRFSKGDYLAGEEGAAVPGGTVMTANVGELLVGWVLWADNKPTQQIMFRVADGKPVPKRSELGHTDQERWEVDSHGEKRDPWQFTNYLPLLAESGELFTFTTSSRGGIGAITKSGGRHLFFRPHGGIACSAGRLGPHVDTRGLGGYVIWWPACGFEVLHREVIAPVPEWIVTALYRATPAPVLAVPVIKGASNTVVAAKLAGIISRAASAQEGERNSVTFWCACRLAEMVRDQMIGRGEAMALLIEAAARTGLSQREILRTASSAFRGAST
jgi:bifunctional DNA primase/polymerase-like protein